VDTEWGFFQEIEKTVPQEIKTIRQTRGKTMDTITTTKGGIVKENKRMVSVHFDSILEVLDYQCETKNKRRFDEYIGNVSTYRRGADWYGKTNREAKDVVNHALGGDQELCRDLLEKISSFEESIGANRANYVGKVEVQKRKRVNGDFGNEIDIHKVYQGNVGTAWTDMVREVKDSVHPLVTLVIDVVGHSGESCNASFWRAAVALHVTQELIAAGKSVKIIAAECSVNSMFRDSRKLSTSITVKEFNQPVSIERIAAMTHLGFFRTFNFAAKQVQEAECRGNLGQPTDLNDKNVSLHIQEEIAEGHTKLLHIPRVNNLRGAEKALKSVYNQITDYKN
jgi:hypothetical protein